MFGQVILLWVSYLLFLLPNISTSKNEVYGPYQPRPIIICVLTLRLGSRSTYLLWVRRDGLLPSSRQKIGIRMVERCWKRQLRGLATTCVSTVLPIFLLCLTQFKGKTFKVPQYDRWVVIVSSPELIEEVRRAPENLLSFTDANDQARFSKLWVGNNTYITFSFNLSRFLRPNIPSEVWQQGIIVPFLSFVRGSHRISLASLTEFSKRLLKAVMTSLMQRRTVCEWSL